MDLVEFSTVVAKLGEDRRLSALELIEAWAAHILRIYHERTLPTDSRDAWGVHDLAAALFLRDQLQHVMQSNGVPPEATPAIVAAIDELYRALTVLDEHSVLTKLHPDVRPDSWWWGRIPASGPIAVELRGLAQDE